MVFKGFGSKESVHQVQAQADDPLVRRDDDGYGQLLLPVRQTQAKRQGQ